MIKIIILSLIQGLTEFLPVSSSGHLVFFESVLKYNPKGIGLEVLLHISTSLSIIVYFSKKILNFYKNYYKEVIIGIIPAGITGFLFKGFFERFFDFPSYLFLFFFINSIILFFARERGNERIDIKKALFIGFTQVLSIFPGISRSGITISSGLILKCERKETFQFSFLMGLPIILGSGVIEFENINLNFENILSFLITFFTGLLSLYILDKILKIKKFHYFSFYTLFLSIISFFIL